jgi:hypothetical protein
MHRGDLRDAVDAMLAAEKNLYGQATWIETEREGDHRISYPLMIAGEISEATLTIKAYPRCRDLRFRIILSYMEAVWRLDFVEDEGHLNSFDRPPHLPGGFINDPHYHSWEDNRRFSKPNKLSNKLYNANVLANNIRTYENAYRWFCGETNIIVDPPGIPQLPPSDRLL